MANRRDFFYKQKVTESELDQACTDLEEADRDLAVSLALTGVVSGLTLAQASSPNMTVDLSSGVAYDKLGERCEVPSTQSVNCALDYLGASTTVATPGNHKILRIFIQFARTLSDPRIDGNGTTVQHSRAESFQILVVQGSEGASPSPPATPGALTTAGAIILGDVTLHQGDTTIANGDISSTYREDYLRETSGSQSIAVGTPKAGLSALLALIAAHVDDSAGAHAASAVSYAGSATNWANGDAFGASTVEGAIDAILTALADSTGTDSSGASRIGFTAQASIAATTVENALVELSVEMARQNAENEFSEQNTFQQDVFFETDIDVGGHINVDERIDMQGGASDADPNLLSSAVPGSDGKIVAKWRGANASGSVATYWRLQIISKSLWLTFNCHFESGDWIRDNTTENPWAVEFDGDDGSLSFHRHPFGSGTFASFDDQLDIPAQYEGVNNQLAILGSRVGASNTSYQNAYVGLQTDSPAAGTLRIGFNFRSYFHSTPATVEVSSTVGSDINVNSVSFSDISVHGAMMIITPTAAATLTNAKRIVRARP